MPTLLMIGLHAPMTQFLGLRLCKWNKLSTTFFPNDIGPWYWSFNLSTQILCHLVVMTSVVCFFENFKNHWFYFFKYLRSKESLVQVGWNLFKIKGLLVPVISKTLNIESFHETTDKEPMVFWPDVWYPHNIFENCDYRPKPFLPIFGEPVGKWVYICVNS